MQEGLAGINGNAQGAGGSSVSMEHDMDYNYRDAENNGNGDPGPSTGSRGTSRGMYEQPKRRKGTIQVDRVD